MIAGSLGLPSAPDKLGRALLAGCCAAPQSVRPLSQIVRRVKGKEVSQGFVSSPFQLAQTSMRRCSRARSSASRAKRSPTWRTRLAF